MTLPQERLEDRSVYYFTVNLFSDAPFIKIVDAFPESETLTLPTIAVRNGTILTAPWEMGARKRYKGRYWFFDIFAKTKDQRDDIGYRLLNALELPIAVYNYNEGFPPDITPSQLGSLLPDEIRFEPIEIIPEIVGKENLYFRAQVTLVAYFNNF